MISKYSMFHQFFNHSSTLVVVFAFGSKPTDYKRIGDIGVAYSNDRIIAYNFFNVNKLVKIRATGIIYLPSNALIDVLNYLLGDNLPHLSYKEHSGFVITGVFEINPYSEKEELYYLVDAPKSLVAIVYEKGLLNKNDVIVLAEEDTMLPNGKIVTKRHLCTGFDLGIDDDKEKILKLDNLYTLGDDFFRMEEN